MMRGGGESGNKAVALWFLQEDGASRSLDAEQRGAVVREQLGFTMDPACSELLTRLVGDGGDSDPRVLSKEGLKVWMRGRFPAYHVRQMLKSVDFLTPIVTQLLGSAPQRDGLEHWRLLAKEDVRQVLGASMNEWVDAIHSKISAFQHAVGKQDVAAPNLMFAGDLGSCGNTFERESGQVRVGRRIRRWARQVRWTARPRAGRHHQRALQLQLHHPRLHHVKLRPHVHTQGGGEGEGEERKECKNGHVLCSRGGGEGLEAGSARGPFIHRTDVYALQCSFTEISCERPRDYEGQQLRYNRALHQFGHHEAKK
jgi:hypothetical protein